MDAALVTVALAVVLVGVGFIALTVLGVWLLARRAQRSRAVTSSRRDHDGSALLRADEAVRLASDELAFAVAQFGEAGTASYRAALERARGELRRAFEIQQRLTERPTADQRRRREWGRDVSAIARRVTAELEEEKRRFAERRSSEANAAAVVAALRERRSALAEEIPRAGGTLEELATRYAERVIEGVGENPAEAERLLGDVDGLLAEVERELRDRAVTDVGERLDEARDALARAASLLDAIAHRRDELAAAGAGFEKLREELAAEVGEARELRDNPPDADSAAVLGAAIEAADAALRELPTVRERDPIVALDLLVDLEDKLDVAVAAARNQQRRLDGARGALGGALLSARTQIASVRDYIAGRHGRVGVDARTRLAEAERELLIAENTADPVEALDAARRAATHARDADALARYRG